ncbi:MAG: DUF4446 family protein [bacterium]|nr:DUF4446 family protein [bacterium]
MNNPYLYVSGALGIVNLFLIVLLAWRFFKYRKVQVELLRGEQVGNLEGLVLEHKKTLQSHRKNLKELGKILEELVENNKFNIQKVAVIRFNPFAEAGSNMSFVLALLDGKDNGIVISSLHGREGTRIYSKSVIAGNSDHHLTDEEKQVIERARGTTNN